MKKTSWHTGKARLPHNQKLKEQMMCLGISYEWLSSTSGQIHFYCLLGHYQHLWPNAGHEIDMMYIKWHSLYPINAHSQITVPAYVRNHVGLHTGLLCLINILLPFRKMLWTGWIWFHTLCWPTHPPHSGWPTKPTRSEAATTNTIPTRSECTMRPREQNPPESYQCGACHISPSMPPAQYTVWIIVSACRSHRLLRSSSLGA